MDRLHLVLIAGGDCGGYGTSAVNGATRDGVSDLYCGVKTTTELRPIYLRSVCRRGWASALCGRQDRNT